MKSGGKKTGGPPRGTDPGGPPRGTDPGGPPRGTDPGGPRRGTDPGGPRRRPDLGEVPRAPESGGARDRTESGDGRETSPVGEPVDWSRFPALTDFLRGYLHEDFPEEHGSSEEAARAFLRAASSSEREALLADWATLSRTIRGLSLEQIRTLLADDLGCAWQPGSLDEMDRLGSALGFAPMSRDLPPPRKNDR
jgi:hypothetical protein